MKIFLIRHGESVANTGENASLGLADHRVTLTDKGRKQAERAAHFLNEYLLSNYKEPAINYRCRAWYSPYDRTKETMEIFNSICNFHDYYASIREDILLTEQQFGLFDSIPEDRWEELFPAEYKVWNTFKSQKGKFWARLPMGESPFDVAVRVRTFFGTIRRDYEDHNIDTLFIFTHGTTLRTFVMQYLHKSVEWYEEEKNPGNCWIRLIEDKIDRGYIYKGEKYPGNYAEGLDIRSAKDYILLDADGNVVLDKDDNPIDLHED